MDTRSYTVVEFSAFSRCRKAMPPTSGRRMAAQGLLLIGKFFPAFIPTIYVAQGLRVRRTEARA
jgi:hypothetical protein